MVPKLWTKTGEGEGKKDNEKQDEALNQKGFGHIKKNKTVKFAKVRQRLRSMLYDWWDKNKTVGRKEMKTKRAN